MVGVLMTETIGGLLNGGEPDLATPDDPQMLVAAAINDVIELARVMSAQGLGRGVVEMRRRLRVMDAALKLAEQAGMLQDGQCEGNA